MTGARVGVGARRPNGPFLRRVLPRSPWAAAMAAWHLHRDLLSNAGSLVMSTGVASLLGVVYWMFATRLFSQRAVGYGSAAVSAMTLLGTIGMLGLGTLLIGELPRRTGRAAWCRPRCSPAAWARWCSDWSSLSRPRTSASTSRT